MTLLRQRGPLRETRPPPNGPPVPPPGPSALDILNDRFARDEIDEEEYARRRFLIEGTGPGGGHCASWGDLADATSLLQLRLAGDEHAEAKVTWRGRVSLTTGWMGTGLLCELHGA